MFKIGDYVKVNSTDFRDTFNITPDSELPNGHIYMITHDKDLPVHVELEGPLFAGDDCCYVFNADELELIPTSGDSPPQPLT